MADVAQKIKSGDSQPKTSRAVVAIAGCKALAAAEKLTVNILDSQFTKDQPVALIEVKLDAKFDDKTYYTS